MIGLIQFGLVLLTTVCKFVNGDTFHHNLTVTSTASSPNNEVKLGNQFNITCTYTNLRHNNDLGVPSIKWLKKSGCSSNMETVYLHSGISTPVLPGFAVSPLSLDSGISSGSLYLSEQTIMDVDGCVNYTYTCELKTFEGVEADFDRHVYRAELNITLTDPAKILNISSDVAVTSGDSIMLSCVTSGLPAPVVTWTRRDKSPLPANIGGGYSYQTLDGLLNLPAVTKEASGTYVCSARNRIVDQPIIRSVSIQVQYAPQISVDSLRVLQKVAYHTELSCEVKADPPVQSSLWYRQSADTQISLSEPGAEYMTSIETTDERLVVTRQTDEYNSTISSTLEIQGVKRSDYTTHYCCQFSNAVGSRHRCMAVLESKTPVSVNGRKPRKGRSSLNHSSVTTLNYIYLLLTGSIVMYSLLTTCTALLG